MNEKYEKHYKEARAKEDLKTKFINDACAEIAENMVKKGIKRGSDKWVYYNWKGLLEIEKHKNVRFIFDWRDNLRNWGLLSTLRAWFIYKLVRLGL